MPADLRYKTEEEMNRGHLSALRIAVEFLVMMGVVFLALHLGGVHQHAHPEAELDQVDSIPALLIGGVCGLAFVAFRLWRSRAVARDIE